VARRRGGTRRPRPAPRPAAAPCAKVSLRRRVGWSLTP